MKRYAYLFLIIALVYVVILMTTNVSAQNPGGGSITYCTVKQSDGRLQLCTPVPGSVVNSWDHDHHYPTPTHRPKKTKTPTRTPMPTTTATETRNPYCLNGAGQWVICPAIPSGK